jgi:hypothetical protein
MIDLLFNYIYGKVEYIYVMSINVYIEILKLFYFFNQLIIVINQGAFSFWDNFSCFDLAYN